MTREDAVKVLNAMWKYKHCGFSEKEIREALDMAIDAIETVEEFEKAQIITGGRLNGRTFAYKCGLEDGKRKSLRQEPCNDFNIMTKLEETNDLKKEFEECKCMMLPRERIIFDIAKSLAIIADELSETKKAKNIFDVYKNEKNEKREELIECLTMIKKQARYSDLDTFIEDVRLSSFNFVIDKVIKLLEAESEEKNEATK